MINPEEMAGFHDELATLAVRIEQLRAAESGTDTAVLLAELETAHEELYVADEELRIQQEELTEVLRGERSERWARERLVAAMPAAVVVTDERGMIRSVNAAAAGLLGAPSGHLVRRPLFNRVHQDARAAARLLLQTVLREDQHEFRTSWPLVTADGREVEVTVAGTMTECAESWAREVTWLLVDAGISGSSEARLGRTLVALTGLQTGARDRSKVLTEVASMCQDAFEVRVATSITLGPPLSPELVSTDSRLAQQMDGAQVVAGEGPCQTAWDDRVTVCSRDLRSDTRWPRLDRHLADVPVESVVSVPLFVGEEIVGSLNLYGTEEALCTEGAAVSAELLGSTLCAVLQEIEIKTELTQLNDHLGKALESRATIDQAKGIVMATEGCDADEAFTVLARLSSVNNVKLRDVAARVVALAAEGHRAVSAEGLR